MGGRAALGLLCVVVLAVLPARPAGARDEASAVSALLGDLQAADFDKAYAAAERLGQYRAHRARIVPALIEALRTREWSRCGGDVRDAVARTLGEFGAREAVPALLELVKSGKPIEHECVE